MAIYSTTNLGPYFEKTSVSPFTVDVSDLGPALNPSETVLDIRGGYAGALTNVMASDGGYGGAGVQEINAPKITVMDRIKNFVDQNPVLTVGLGIFGLMLLKGGGGGRRR